MAGLCHGMAGGGPSGRDGPPRAGTALAGRLRDGAVVAPVGGVADGADGPGAAAGSAVGPGALLT